MPKEYIEREAVIDLITRRYENPEICKAEINAIPAADVAPVVHGRWEWFENWNPGTPEYPTEREDCGWMCGKCKTALYDVVGGYWDDPDDEPKLKFCPNCGAKMEV